MNFDFKEQDSMHATPLRLANFRYSNTLLPLLSLSLPIGCLASR